MKKTVLVLLLSLATKPLLARHPLQSLAPYQPSGFSLTADEKLEIYQDYAVEKTSAKISTVNGNLHRQDVMRRYYKNSNATEALLLEEEGDRLQHQKNVFFFSSLCTGAALGLGSGIIIASNQSEYDGSSFELIDKVIVGVVITLAGTVTGTLIGGVGAMADNVRANHRYDEAGKAYNKSLLQQLNLSIAPIPGGAKAGASLRF